MNFDNLDDEISRAARSLHREWDSPELWRRIETEVRRPRAAARPWAWTLATAATVLLALALWQPAVHRAQPPALMTDEALREVQQAEAAYTRSIDRLAKIAAPTLDRSPAPLAEAYREKLDLLDSAIADLKRTADGNRYNVYVETQLASLYREKEKTLEDWLQNAKQN